MNETIDVVKVDDIKVPEFKGHTIIELTDVNTGEVEKLESDNMVTNALHDILSYVYKTHDRGVANSRILPFATMGLGGIYLFETALSESVANTQLPPSSVSKLIGYAGHTTSDGNDTQRGDFNPNESETLSNGYKFVWDFGTDDANGTINALALTHHIAGYHGYHYDPYCSCQNSSSYLGNKPNGSCKGIDGVSPQSPSTQLAITSRIIKDSKGYICELVYFINTTTLRIRKWRILLDNIGLKEGNVGAVAHIGDEDITVSEPAMSYAGYQSWYFCDGGDGYYYGFAIGNNQLWVSKFNMTSKQYTQAVSRSYTVDGYSMWSMGTTDGYFYATYPAVRDGYVYIPICTYNSNYKYKWRLYKFELADLSHSVLIYDDTTQYQSLNYLGLFKRFDGVIESFIWEVNSDDSVLNKDAAYYFDQGGNNSYGGRIFTTKEMVLYHFGYSSYGTYNNMYLLPNLKYLATINNLPTPVVKTASKTMKITYTITEAT